ncbi:MAG: right-handed parallel beta-helix repeat-containing protein, partial [Lentisphaerae bacterium]|nr:right-handed parallel beta-helix repeat-containing protein [Lentisphaerota bacterium]
VRFAALDLNHTSDMGTTWQTCHPFAPDTEQFEWFDRVTRMAEEPVFIAIQNEQNNAMRHRKGWGELFQRCNLVVTGFGYYAEFAEDGETAFYNTSVNGLGTPYKDGKSKFLASRNSYLLLTFRAGAPVMAELKTLDGEVLHRKEHEPRRRGLAALPAAPATADFVVSPRGDDGASGAPGAPFRTLQRARDAVRTLRRESPDLVRPVVVEVLGGTYWLDTVFQLEAADSGTVRSPTVYRAAKGAEAILSGGRPLRRWEMLPNGHWRGDLPHAAPTDWAFAQLWVNGQRRYRPRLPKKAFYAIASKAPSSPDAPEGRFDRFRFYENDIDPSWIGTDTEVLLPRRWWMSRLRLKSVDSSLNEATLASTTWGGRSYVWTRPERNDRFLIVNAPHSLSEPGEWQLSVDRKSVTYIPLPGERLDEANVVAPLLQRLVILHCGETRDTGVKHVRFEGLVFAHSNWNLPPEGYSFPQAEVALSGAIVAEGASECAFVGCSVEHTGEYAFDFGLGCRDIRIEGCELTELGAGGVLIGSKTGGHMKPVPANRRGPEWVASGITVRDCLIAHGGRLHMAAVGVGITHAHQCLIDHNTILDFTYTGVTVGWNWGFSHSDSHHNIVSYNHIHTIGQGVLSDLGGIYTLGVSPGTALIGNHIHDVDRLKYGGWGIYHDSGSSRILSRNNLVYDTRDGSFMQGKGRENRQVNNIFAYGRETQLNLYNSTENAAATLERNILLWTGAKFLGRPWLEGKHRLNRNLYFRTDGPAEFAGKGLSEWRDETEQDLDSLEADPGFADAAERDFRLRPSSPALALGFRPFDAALAGRRTGTDPKRDAWPKRAWPKGKRMPAPRPFETGFEGLPEGTQPLLPDCYQDDDMHRIVVTGAFADGGERALEFRDGRTKNSWNPHLVYATNWRKGTLRCEFSLRLQAGARLMHEWRTSMPPFVASGPHFDTDAEGWLQVAGKKAVKLPFGQWVRISVECPLGTAADRTWILNVRLPDGTETRYADLPVPKAFDRLGWLGFVAMAEADVVFHLDDVSLQSVAE